MLALKRRIREVVIIPNINMKIKVLNVINGTVTLNFSAPKDVEVIRSEAKRKPRIPKEHGLMLVLTRRTEDVVLIPEINMEIKVIEINKDGTVRLGFSAPKDIEVVRAEAKVKTRKPTAREGNS